MAGTILRDWRSSGSVSATAAESGTGQGQLREALPLGARLVEPGPSARHRSGAVQQSLPPKLCQPQELGDFYSLGEVQAAI